MSVRVPGGYNPASVAITGGTVTGTNAPYNLFRYAIPIVILPTTTYNNNGAAVLGTAANTTYANFYAVVPANSIAAGVPAATDIYFAQASTTTAITLFNNLLSANLDANGGPTIPASPTAFATTGAGSVAGVTGSVNLLTLVLPASTIGTTGKLSIDGQLVTNNAATGKALSITFGGTSLINASIGASKSGGRLMATIANRNSASVQNSIVTYLQDASSPVVTTAYPAVNTAAGVNVVFAMTHGTATDVAGIETLAFDVLK